MRCAPSASGASSCGGSPVTDPLGIIWSVLDAPQCLFTAEAVAAWPVGWLQTLVDVNLVRPGPSADRVICPACADRHVEEVIARQGRDGRTRYFVPCPEALRVEIPTEYLSCWILNLDGIAQAIAGAMTSSRRCTVRIPERLWRLGRVMWQSAGRDVLLARGLLWRDGARIANEIGTHGRGIVLVADQVPENHPWPELPPPVIALSSVASLNGRTLELNHADVAAVVNDVDAKNRAVRPITLTRKQQKQVFRQAAGDVLKSVIKDDDHVRAYLTHSSYRAAANALSAQFGFKISKDKVKRAIDRRGGIDAVRQDNDSDSVRRTVASQRRDRQRKFASPSQPPDLE